MEKEDNQFGIVQGRLTRSKNLQQFPKKWQSSIDIIFDGIDAQLFKPLDENRLKQGLKIPGIELPTDIPLVTYTTRGFEPYRGWPQVAEGLSLLMQRNPQVHILLVGSDEVAYGAKRDDGMSWREWNGNMLSAV